MTDSQRATTLATDCAYSYVLRTFAEHPLDPNVNYWSIASINEEALAASLCTQSNGTINVVVMLLAVLPIMRVICL